MLTIDQIKNLLEIIETNTNIFISKHIGSDYLTAIEKSKLFNIGINPNTLYNPKLDLLTQSFYFGLISDAMKNDAKKLSFERLREHFMSGRHIPLTNVEKYTIESIKHQFLGDIRANNNRIFSDVNNIILGAHKNNREAYENIIRKEILEGYSKRKLSSEIARDLAKKTGDWSRDFDRIVEFVSHYAFNEGRLAAIEKDNENGDNNSLAYFDVYPGACKHCIRLYLTNGYGSKPIIFKVSELKKNGTNIGRKVQNWLPCISGSHPYCRCTINIYKDGFQWDEDLKIYDTPKSEVLKPRRDRALIEFEVDGVVYNV